VWLPEGLWWGWDTRERLAGARRLELSLPLDRYPLFVRDGAAIPLAEPRDSVACRDGGPVPVSRRAWS
jgi:alpha-D-xyloside xylohydrolase